MSALMLVRNENFYSRHDFVVERKDECKVLTVSVQYSTKVHMGHGGKNCL
jgi:hypothetical protein